MKKATFIFLAVLVVVVLYFHAHALANGVLMNCIGPASTGRGGTNIAHADNSAMIHDNPAALANMDGAQAGLSLDFITLPMEYTDPSNDESAKDTLSTLPSCAYMKPYGTLPMGIGIGFYNPAGFSADYDLLHPYGEQRYYSKASLSKVLLGAGMKINNALSLGIAMGAAYSKLELELPYTFQTGTLAGTPALIDLEGDKWIFTWNVGAQWDISENTVLGLTYRCQDQFSMSGDLDIDIPPIGLPDTSAHYKARFTLTWPQSVGAGLWHRMNDNHKLSCDIVWVNWSSAFDEWTLKMSESDNAGYDAAAGTTPQDTLPLNWKDSYSFRLGYEYLLNPKSASRKDTIRFGYIYDKSPVPDSTLTPLVPGILTHMLTIGYGRELGNWALNCAYLYSFKSEQSVGTSEIQGGDFDSSSVAISTHFFSLGIGYKFN
ncbi:MAG: OmpP1/FadL family transporter [bacterium]